MNARSTRPRVVVLQHADCEPLGTLQPIFDDAFDVVALRLVGDPVAYHHAVETLVKSRAFDGLVALGGPMSVCERERVEGLDDSLRLLKLAVHADVPILGICLGAQLLALTLGAQVRPGAIGGRRKEIGWLPVELTERGRVDPAFHGFGEREPVFHWHGDTYDLPQGGRLLASSSGYPNQAFRWGRWVYGIQFHLEVTPALVLEWTHRYADELAALDYVDAPAMVSRASVHADGLREKARVLGGHFVECVRESVRQRGEPLR